MELFGVGAGEALVVLVITLLVVGPQRFPEIAREGGKYFRMARRFTAEVMDDVKGAINDLEQEVGTEDDLRAVRELGHDLQTDMRRIGSDTETAASLQTPADEVALATSPPASTESTEATETLEGVRESQPLGERAAAEAASEASESAQTPSGTTSGWAAEGAPNPAPATPAPWPPPNVMDQIRASYSWVTPPPSTPASSEPAAPSNGTPPSSNGAPEADRATEAERTAHPESGNEAPATTSASTRDD